MLTLMDLVCSSVEIMRYLSMLNQIGLSNFLVQGERINEI